MLTVAVSHQRKRGGVLRSCAILKKPQLQGRESALRALGIGRVRPGTLSTANPARGAASSSLCRAVTAQSTGRHVSPWRPSAMERQRTARSSRSWRASASTAWSRRRRKRCVEPRAPRRVAPRRQSDVNSVSRRTRVQAATLEKKAEAEVESSKLERKAVEVQAERKRLVTQARRPTPEAGPDSTGRRAGQGPAGGAVAAGAGAG